MVSKSFRDYVLPTNNFPKKGIVYWDFTPLLLEPTYFKKAILAIKNEYQEKTITKIVAIESKGFLLGAALAYELELPLILVRKSGLTPGKVIKIHFTKEYGKAEYEMKKGILNSMDRVLIVYDIFAGKGAFDAAKKLIEMQKAQVMGCASIIELTYLGGRKELNAPLFSLVKILEKKV
jgi:adenine phosphoribosyltransferase